MYRDRGFGKMSTLSVCLVFLFLAHEVMCSDSEQEWKATEEFLNSLLTSKISRSQWRASLLDMCGLVHGLPGRGQEAWLNNGEGLAARQSLSTQPLEELYDLESLCRVLQPREAFNEYLESHLSKNSENVPKRKSPYILKRQLHMSKSRRPYILKRSLFY